MKNCLVIAFACALLAFASCSNSETKSASTTDSTAVKTDSTAVAVAYKCPMACEGDKTYAEAGKCPVCGMDLEKVN